MTNPQPPKTINEILDQLPTDPPAPAAHPDTDPRQSPKFLLGCAQTADILADELARNANCPCRLCKLSLFYTRVAAFMARETLQAAITGDTAKLQAVVDVVERLKSETEKRQA